MAAGKNAQGNRTFPSIQSRFRKADARSTQATADGKALECSVHGSAQEPRQEQAPEGNSAMSRLMKEFKGMTMSLTFLEDGLHAVLVIERK
jgi:hypothetical protein